MSLTDIHRFLTARGTKLSQPQVLFWFSLSLTFAAIYSLLALQEAFSHTYVIQDDARQHVFWMQRFVDPALFPDDLIADYFQAVAPAGYTALYWGMAKLGLSPILLSKLLPLVLSLLTAGYCFVVTLQLFPIPAAAFSSTLLLSQALGLTDAIVSGTPKAFIYPLLLAFLYFRLRGALWPCLGAIALQGLFYPQLVFIAAGTLLLQLLDWRPGYLGLCRDSDQRRFSLAGLMVAGLVLLPYVLKSSEFGPVISLAQAQVMPEFLEGGRSRFFYADEPMKFWLHGRGGIRANSVLTPITNSLGVLLLLLPWFPKAFPLVKQLTQGIMLLPRLLLVSLGMFFLAHWVLFKLHLPSRYTEHSLRVIMTLSAGIVLILLMDAVWQWAVLGQGHRKLGKATLALGTTGLLSCGLLFYPSFVDQFPITRYQVGTAPALYAFLRSQPKDTLVASLSGEANNLPTFAQRSILVGDEYAIPYHAGYYRRFRQRAIDLINAQYSSDPRRARDFIRRYGTDFWLLDRRAFTPGYLEDKDWIWQYQPAATQALDGLTSGQQPAIATTIDTCSVFETPALIALQADCLLATLQP